MVSSHSLLRLGLICAVLLVLPACSTNRSLEELRHTPMRGTAYQSVLASKYLQYAEVSAELYDWSDSAYFADKGLQAAYGHDVEPELPENWKIDEAAQMLMTEARAKIMRLLTGENKQQQPKAAAEAVFYYDCMLERMEEGGDDSEVTFCHDGLVGAIASLEAAVKAAEAVPEIKPITQPAPEPMVNYLVYFGLERWVLDDVGMRVVQAIVDKLAAMPEDVQVVLNGHTDTSGSDRFNMNLSWQRADAVKEALIALGIQADRITNYGFGETDPAVPTADEVYEPKNRRVEIIVN